VAFTACVLVSLTNELSTAITNPSLGPKRRDLGTSIYRHARSAETTSLYWSSRKHWISRTVIPWASWDNLLIKAAKAPLSFADKLRIKHFQLTILSQSDLFTGPVAVVFWASGPWTGLALSRSQGSGSSRPQESACRPVWLAAPGSFHARSCPRAADSSSSVSSSIIAGSNLRLLICFPCVGSFDCVTSILYLRM